MSDPSVIYEDANMVVLDKPGGLQVHPARVTHERLPRRIPPHTLTDWLVARYPEMKKVGDDPAQRPGIVHRLDKETSGVMIAARTEKAFAYLKSLFQKREVKKTYLAVVVGHLKKKRGVIDAPIGIRAGTTKRSIHSAKMMKEAVTEYRVLREFPANHSLLEVLPKTGRTHQIRVHLASIGHPVLGDRLYGPKGQAGKGVGPPSRLMLHALSIEFTSLDGKRVKFEAEPPPEFGI